MTAAPGGAEIGVVAVKAVDAVAAAAIESTTTVVPAAAAAAEGIAATTAGAAETVAATAAEGASVAEGAAEAGAEAIGPQIAEVVGVAQEVDGVGMEVLASGAPNSQPKTEGTDGPAEAREWGTPEPIGTTGTKPEDPNSDETNDPSADPVSTEAVPANSVAPADMSPEQGDQALQEAQDVLEIALANGTDEEILSAQERLNALKPENTAPTNEAAESVADEALEPEDTRPFEVRLREAEINLAEADARYKNAVASGDTETITKAEEEKNIALARYNKLNIEQNEPATSEPEDTRPLDKRLDEARNKIEVLDRLLIEAQRTGDTETIARLHNEKGSINAYYHKLLGSADEEFQRSYLEKVKEEEEKKQKEPFLKKLLRILKYSVVVVPGSVVSSGFSDLKDAATEPPPPRR